MPGKLLLLLLLLPAWVRANVGSSTGFSNEELVASAANLTSVQSRLPARSDIECAALASARTAVSAGLYLEKEGLCLLIGNSGIGAAVSSIGQLLRKEWSKPEPAGAVSNLNYGFTVIQQRSSGRVLFNETWAKYKAGFGNADEFWLGLDEIHNLTAAAPRLLRIELTLMSGDFFRFDYANFSVDSEANFYGVSFGNLNAAYPNVTGGASLLVRNGKKFSTTDSDNVPGPKKCSSATSSGWWFDDDCTSCNLNGAYNSTAATPNDSRFFWDGLGPAGTLIRACRMMIR